MIIYAMDMLIGRPHQNVLAFDSREPPSLEIKVIYKLYLYPFMTNSENYHVSLEYSSGDV